MCKNKNPCYKWLVKLVTMFSLSTCSSWLLILVRFLPKYRRILQTFLEINTWFGRHFGYWLNFRYIDQFGWLVNHLHHSSLLNHEILLLIASPWTKIVQMALLKITKSQFLFLLFICGLKIWLKLNKYHVIYLFFFLNFDNISYFLWPCPTFNVQTITCRLAVFGRKSCLKYVRIKFATLFH